MALERLDNSESFWRRNIFDIVDAAFVPGGMYELYKKWDKESIFTDFGLDEPEKSCALFNAILFDVCKSVAEIGFFYELVSRV